MKEPIKQWLKKQNTRINLLEKTDEAEAAEQRQQNYREIAGEIQKQLGL